MHDPAHPPLFPIQFSPERAVAGSNTQAKQQFFDLGDRSRWFDSIVVSQLEQGESDGLRSFPAASNGNPTETWYNISSGTATFVQADGTRVKLNAFDAVYFDGAAAGELIAEDGPVSWLTIASAGGAPTPLSEEGGRLTNTGPGTERKNALIFNRNVIAPRQWPANTLGASAKPWWFYTVVDFSRWFHSGCVACLPPGGSSTFHSHIEDIEGPYETFYIALRGTALLRSEYEDFLFDSGCPAGVYVPANGAHQIINNGEDLMWYYTISSRGDEPLRVDVYNTPSGLERPGYLEEFNRIVAARRARGLLLP